MKRLLALTFICVAHAQVSSNWTTFAGDPQRSGWERTDAMERIFSSDERGTLEGVLLRLAGSSVIALR